jgi:hypothetical protein
VAKAVAQFLSLRVDAIEEMRQGRWNHQTPVTLDNLVNDIVLLFKQTQDMVARAPLECLNKDYVLGFEIEGVYHLPNTNKGKFMEQLLKNELLGIPSLA